MRLIEILSTCSVYERNGERVWVAHTGMTGGFTVNLTTEQVIAALNAGDLDTADDFKAATGGRWLAVYWCEGDDCGTAMHAGEVQWIEGLAVCPTCFDKEDVTTCGECADTVRTASLEPLLMVGVGYDQMVCSGCYYDSAWCEMCDGYYFGDECPGEHTDKSTRCCEAREQQFAIRCADGSLLPNDTKRTVKTAEGVVSPHGIKAIRDYLLSLGDTYGLSDIMFRSFLYTVSYRIGDDYKNNKGTYAKRFRREFYNLSKTYTRSGDIPAPVAPSDAVIEQIGNLARDYSQGVEVEVTLTRQLNLPADEFAHDSSCWWSHDAEYSYSRCTFKANAGIGLRSFHRSGCVNGRVWVIPVAVNGNTAAATYDETDCYLVFNGYGELEERKGAQALAAITGGSIRTGIDFDNAQMYVNGVATLVGPEDVIAAVSYIEPMTAPC